MSLVRTVDPANEPISLAEAKAHLRVTHTDDDFYILGLIQAARAWIENETRRALLTQTWALTLDGFPANRRYITPADRIDLPRAPVLAVSSITYVDTAGTTQTLAASKYTLAGASSIGYVAPAYGETWPTARDVPEAVTVTFTAGYGADPMHVPAPFLHAMKLLIGQWYANRENINVGNIVNRLPMAVDSLIGPYKIHKVG